jgi:IclR family acetate operon transcriptional repressor
MLVKQAAHVVELLELFARLGRPAALAEVSQQLGWPRSSAFKLLGTLVELGFLYEPRARGGYWPTPRWLELAQAFAHAQPLPPSLGRVLDEVVQRTGETAVLAAPAGAHAVFLQVVDSPHAIRYAAGVGKRVPIHATATGRALLSLHSPAERASLLARIRYERYTDATVMSAEAVEADVAASVARGWFESTGGFTPDLGGVALPLRLDGRRFAILAAGPVGRVSGTYPALAATVREAIERHVAAAAR